jgi:hypothetical protein
MMSNDKVGEQTNKIEPKNSDSRSGIAIALIMIVPTTITAVGGFFVGSNHNATVPPQLPVINSSPPSPIKNLDEEIDINKVRGVFTAATPDQNKMTIHCKGSISNLKPETQCLWIAVEVNGHIWFKRGDFAYNAARTSWTVSINEEGSARTVSLLLYVVTKGADSEIRAWLSKGEGDPKGHYDEITSIDGAYPLDHFNNLQVRD